MMRLTVRSVFLVVFYLVLWASADTIIAAAQPVRARHFKQLGGPPDEMAAMEMPDPAAVGSMSKTAIFRLSPDRRRHEIQVPIESVDELRVMLLGPDHHTWQMQLAMPDGQGRAGRAFDMRADGLAHGLKRVESALGMGAVQLPVEMFRMRGVPAGTLRLEIDQDGAAAGGAVIVASTSPCRLHSYVDTYETVRRRPIGLVASLRDPARPAAVAGTIETVVARIEAPSGAVIERRLFDDGEHHDGLASDGVFGAVFIPKEAGLFRADISAMGANPQGEALLRTHRHLIEVAADRAVLGRRAVVTAVDDLRFRLAIRVRGLSVGQQVLVHADLWGRDARGKPAAVGWIGGMTLVEGAAGLGSQAVVPVQLDARWMMRSGATGGWELRNVRLQSPDSFAVLGRAKSARLGVMAVSAGMRRSYGGEITDEMRDGVRPQREPEK